MNFIANNIKHLRELKNLTQEYFTSELNISRERMACYFSYWMSASSSTFLNSKSEVINGRSKYKADAIMILSGSFVL